MSIFTIEANPTRYVPKATAALMLSMTRLSRYLALASWASSGTDSSPEITLSFKLETSSF